MDDFGSFVDLQEQEAEEFLNEAAGTFHNRSDFRLAVALVSAVVRGLFAIAHAIEDATTVDDQSPPWECGADHR